MPAAFQRSFTALGDSALLWDATEPAKLPLLHPLIRSVTEVSGSETDQAFVVHERVPMGPLTLPNRYRGRRVAGNPIRLEAWAACGVHLVHTLDWRETPGRVQVEHRVEIEAPLVLARYVVRTAQAAHDRWVEAVRGWMAAETVRRACQGDVAARTVEPGLEGRWVVRGERDRGAWELLVAPDGVVLARGYPVAVELRSASFATATPVRADPIR